MCSSDLDGEMEQGKIWQCLVVFKWFHGDAKRRLSNLYAISQGDLEQVGGTFEQILRTLRQIARVQAALSRLQACLGVLRQFRGILSRKKRNQPDKQRKHQKNWLAIRRQVASSAGLSIHLRELGWITVDGWEKNTNMTQKTTEQLPNRLKKRFWHALGAQNKD